MFRLEPARDIDYTMDRETLYAQNKTGVAG